MTALNVWNSNASENVGGVIVELLTDAKPDKVLNDVKSTVDQDTISTRSGKTYRCLSYRCGESNNVDFGGDQELRTLHQLAEQARSEIRQDPNVTQVEIIDV